MRIKYAFTAICMLAYLASCSPANTPTEISTPNKTASAAPSNTITLMPVLTAEPTISNIDSKRYISTLLQDNNGCVVPCIWGINSGLTTFNQAKQFFEHIGWKGESFNNIYWTGIGLPASSTNINVGLFPTSGVVEKIHFGISGTNFIDDAGYFSFRNIVSILGIPSQVLVDIAFTDVANPPEETSVDIFLYYESNQTLIQYAGTAKKHDRAYVFCPTIPNLESTEINARSGSVVFYIGSPEINYSLRELVQPFWIFPGYINISIEKALNMTPEEFYYYVINSNDQKKICFSSPINAWGSKNH